MTKHPVYFPRDGYPTAPRRLLAYKEWLDAIIAAVPNRYMSEATWDGEKGHYVRDMTPSEVAEHEAYALWEAEIRARWNAEIRLPAGDE